MAIRILAKLKLNRFESTVATGTPPLVVASATKVTNLNADQLDGADGLSNPVTAAQGGTGLASYTAGDLLYYAAGALLSKLGIGAANRVLTSSGSVPQWSPSLSLVDLTLSGIAILGGQLRVNTRQVTTNIAAATYNDYDPEDYAIYAFGCAGAVTITGFSGGETGRVLILSNVGGANSMTIKNNDAGSAVGNRIVTLGGTDLVVGPNHGSAILYYNQTQWRAIGL